MALKTYKPVTNAQRQLVLVDRSGLHKGPPVKALTSGQKRMAGRNNTGRVVVRWQGGGHKQSYRIVDFKRARHDEPATVQHLEYDPNRTSFIALIKYKDGTLAYIIAPQRLAAGDVVVSGEKVDVKPGNAMPLSAVPVGTIIHNIEMKPGKGGQIARAAGKDAPQQAFADPACDDVIDTAADALGHEIARAVHLVDPGLIVIGGGLGLNDRYREAIAAAIAQHVDAAYVPVPEIVPEIGRAHV